MEPTLQATYTAAQFGIANFSDGAAVIVDGGSAELIVCGQTSNTAASVSLGAVADPGSGYFVTESPPPAEDWSMVQASDSMALQLAGAEKRLFLFGASTALTLSLIDANGTPGAATTVGSSIGALLKVTSFTVVPDASGDLAALSRSGISGLNLFDIGAGGYLTLTDTVKDTPKSYIAEVSDTASVVVGGQSYLLTLSATENGITSYEVSDTGDADLVDSLGNHDGLAIAGAQALQTAVVGGQTFAIIAATTSDSLSVVRVNDMGCLFQTDHVVDDQTSRIQGASALDVFEVGGRVFVIAGGSDAGLTTYELLPDGTLCLMNAAAFETGQGMGNITSIDTAMNGDTLSIFVTEERADRVQVFTADYSDLGNLITATSSTTTGTGKDDRLLGRSSADTLSGGAGDDFLHDGAGADRLTGGAGADVFVFCADTSTDVITDFELGVDRIDLSDWGRIYSADALTITSTSTGATISFGGNVLTVTNAAGGALTAQAFDDSDFIF